MKSLFNRLLLKLKIRAACERGVTLVEVLVALALLGITASVFLGSAGTVFRALLVNQEQLTAESLAKSQLEYIRSQYYGTEYAVMTIPTESQQLGYQILSPIPVSLLEEGLQKVTVTVKRDERVLFTIDIYKVDR